MAVIVASTQNRNKYTDGRNERDVMNGFLGEIIDQGQPRDKTNYLCNFNDLNYGINVAKKYPKEIFISNHSNAWKGITTGTHIYYHYTSNAGYQLATSFKNILKKYLPHRNISVRPDNQDYATGFYELRATPQPAILLEWFFHDNKSDVDWWGRNKDNCLKGICELVGLQAPQDIKYLVQCGAFANKENAEKLVKSLKSKGFDAIIKEI